MMTDHDEYFSFQFSRWHFLFLGILVGILFGFLSGAYITEIRQDSKFEAIKDVPGMCIDVKAHMLGTKWCFECDMFRRKK